MKERQTISKSLRFDIFKRDAFTCQYCGRRPPDVILELDHIHPVSKGGDNDEMNLVTSCFDCNRGKRDKVLQDHASRPDADLAWLEMQQELAELERYNLGKAKRDNALTNTVELLQEHWLEAFRGSFNITRHMLKYWVNTFGPEEVEKAMSIASPRWENFYNDDACIRYVAGILWKRKRDNAET